jgi:hypothetical protein
VRVAEPGEIDIARVVVGQDDAAGFDIGQDEGVKRGGEVVGDDLQPDAVRLGVQEILVVGTSGRPVLNMSVRKGSRISLDTSESEIS